MVSTTAGIFEDASTVGSFMLPGMSSPEQASCSRVVRFDNECVLIPKTSSRSKMPVVLTKSYSLPLWKRKSNHDSDQEDVAGSSTQPPSPEDNRVTIKVPIPTFRRRTSRSPTPRARSVSSSPIISKSPPSCLVYRSPTVLTPSSVKPLSPVRRPSLPIYHRRQDELTIPLRDCCADCQRITEECLKEGDDWKEKFSRGARRRRSASLEFTDSSMAISTSSQRNANLNKAFTPFSTEGSISKDLSSRFTTTAAAAFSITVDEVDKRRKSFEYNMEDTDFIRTLSPPSDTPPSPSSQVFHSSASLFSSPPGSSRYPRMKPRDREASSSSTVSSASITDELPSAPDILDPRNRLRSSPIEEEDETQLFPLPRRSRSNTPSPSPSPKISPISSPNGSTSSLPVRTPPRLSPKSSKLNSSSSQESILSTSLSRKVGNGQLAAPAVSTARSLAISSSSTISSSPPSPQPKYTRPISGLNIPKVPAAGERVANSPVSPKGPRPFRSSLTSKVLSTYEASDGENNPSSAIQVPVTTSPSATTTPNEISDQHTTLLLVPPIPNFPSTDTIPKDNTALPPFKPAKLKIEPTPFEPVHNNNNTITITKSLSPSSPSSNHPQSSIVGTPSPQRRKLPFTLPFIKAGGAIRDVGVDVLKGVSSISSGGMVGSG